MSNTAQASLMEAWRPLAEKALKGQRLTTLQTVTPSGMMLDPLSAPVAPSYLGRPYEGPWQVVARVDGPNAAEQARTDLENGASALQLVFADAPGAFGRGLTANTVDELDAALDGVMLNLVPLRIEAGASALAAVALVAALFERRGVTPAALHAGIDTFGAFAFSGAWPRWGEPETLARAVRDIRAIAPTGTVLMADGRIAAEAGANKTTELAYVLHSIAGMLRLTDAAGLPASEVLPATAVALSASENQFATIAKFRAMRRLHRLLAEACGVETPLQLHGETQRRMLSFSDPQTNLLRLTVAAFSAGVGGADSVTVQPFDAEASPFARRMARNIQTLLIEESHIGRLSDPSAGAGSIEAYTDALADAAWRRFQMFESEGDAIASGKLEELVAHDRAAQIKRLENEDAAMIGVTIHPPQTPTPVPPETADMPYLPTGTPPSTDFASLMALARDGATLAELAAKPSDTAPTCPPLTPSRVAASFGG